MQKATFEEGGSTVINPKNQRDGFMTKVLFLSVF